MFDENFKYLRTHNVHKTVQHILTIIIKLLSNKSPQNVHVAKLHIQSAVSKLLSK